VNCISIADSSIANDCSAKSGKGVNMENNGCLRQQNRHSVSLGGDLAKGGLFCMVRYKDGDCHCIEGGKLYQWPKFGADYCENQNIEGYTSFHFEKIDDFNVSLTTRSLIDTDSNRGAVRLVDAMGVTRILSSGQGIITMGVREKCTYRTIELRFKYSPCKGL